jgi:hypothetical protein
MKNGIIFWGNSTNGEKEVRTMVGAKPITSCRSLLKKLDILPVLCQYICPLINFPVGNQEHFQTN